MTSRTKNRTIGCAAIVAVMSQAAPGASFLMLNDPSLSTGFEQRWNDPAIWQLVSGVDDGTAGIPDGNDTFTIDRNVGAFPAGNTDLSNEGLNSPHGVAGITATGAPGRDMILKHTADIVTIGDLTLLASASSFHIEEERAANLIINGVISGAGDLLISRAGSFSTVNTDDLITLTGSSLNTISGSITLRNTSTSQPAYFVADKVGAFGQAPTVTLEGPNGGATSLRLTAITVGGEGAFDDDATALLIGANSLLSVDAGVDEFIGSGNLTVDGIGSIADGIYTNSESWITGGGTITVGVPEPSSLAVLGLGGLLGLIRRRR